MTFEELEIQVSNLIAKDEVEAAITLLSRYFHGNEKLQAIVLQSGRFHSLRKDQMNGVIDYATVQQQLNQLRAGILDFVRSQKSNPLWENIQEVTTPEVEVNYQELYRVSLTRVAVALALREAPEGLSITRVHQVSGGQRRKYIVLALKEMEAGGLIEKHKMSRTTYWKLSEAGSKLASELGRSLRLNADER
ncbi:MAG: hypothetical protein KDD19_07130 [Phaeodactylibacter sp.]|nr:hypothetical protein [Phaeodactylibacter sp.]